MRKFFYLTAFVGLLAAAPIAFCQQQSQSKPSADSSAASQPAAQPSAPQHDALAEAARRARDQKKEAQKPARVFDNDNIPSTGNISTVGSESPEGASDGSAQVAGNPGEASAAGASAPPAAGDEKAWRDRFAKLHDKLSRDEKDLEIMQRELGVLDVVNYPDPQKTLQQETTRGDINKKTTDIEKQKKKIEADKQAISNAEDELRKSGGDSGWAR
jgi:hypothetical protein